MDKFPPLHSTRRLCCSHADLHPALGFLHQAGEEGVHEVCAKDRGKEGDPGCILHNFTLIYAMLCYATLCFKLYRLRFQLLLHIYCNCRLGLIDLLSFKVSEFPGCDLAPLPLQATAFLLLGFLVMIGSMSLIILDWIHNAMAEAPADGH